MGRLDGKKALVTGGDSGIGRAVSIAFAREGADVAINFIHGDDEDARRTKEDVLAAGREAMLLEGDIGDEDVVRDIAAMAAENFGRIDILVNNAGLDDTGRLEDTTLDVWERIMKTNITGMFLMVKHCLPLIPDGGRIINTGSIEGFEGNPTDLPYSASKGAVHSFTKSLSKYLVDRKILVNAVAPGPVDTPLLRAEHPELLKSGGGDKYPLGIAQPEQIAGSYVFLASDESTYYSGEILAPTGGKVTAA